MEMGLILREQLESLHAISIEVASLRELSEVQDRALGYCLELTSSEFGFVGLLDDTRSQLDVAAIKGFLPSDPRFYERFRLIPVRPSVFGVVITEERSNISNDVAGDPAHIGQPHGHPPVRTFLGVPLRVGTTVIGMLGVANKDGGYAADDERLLSTFANQVAVAIDNARLYQRQREMIDGLENLHRRLDEADREQMLAEERHRIAAGLHDHIEQGIFTIGLQVHSLLEAGVPPDVADRLRDVSHRASRTAEAVRDVIFALSAPSPDNGELSGSVRLLLRDIARTHGLETDLVVSGEPLPAPPAVQLTLRAVVREALANVVRHARARMILVSIRYVPDRVDVVIQDDGVGAPELVLRSYQDSHLHFGMKHMRQQVLALDGRFRVANGEERGLTVHVSVPLAGRAP
ncbi:MAG TPA: GAF domain-containing protein [Candidatus Dormibacteraeota bacterium]|nr:GAF domain-containing protein [Candidatus Dormibacteraeota bacterium]